jgi:uncharacterized protein (DUF1501 family)
MECGADHLLQSGWLNRVAGTLPASATSREGDAVAVSLGMPLLLHGPARVASWAPHGFGEAPADLYTEVSALAASDALIGPAIREGLRARGFSHEVLAEDGEPIQQGRSAFVTLATVAGEMLARPDGPRLAALEIGGWDTHVAQVPRLNQLMAQFDAGLAALKQGLGPVWRDTAVLTMTEFGRTARVNGDKGTDHGTATVSFVFGRAVAGGRVVGTWPGLDPGRLFEDRDLQPTTDMRSVVKGLLTQHLGIGPVGLAAVFPDSGAAPPMQGLIRV